MFQLKNRFLENILTSPCSMTTNINIAIPNTSNNNNINYCKFAIILIIIGPFCQKILNDSLVIQIKSRKLSFGRQSLTAIRLVLKSVYLYFCKINILHKTNSNLMAYFIYFFKFHSSKNNQRL